MQKDVRHLAERVSYLTEALEKEKIISKRKTVEKRGKMLRSRRSIVADELLLLGRASKGSIFTSFFHILCIWLHM